MNHIDHETKYTHDDFILTALQEKIQRLEYRVKQLEAELIEVGSTTLEATMGSLRLRQIILIYLGNEDSYSVADEISNSLGHSVAEQAFRHLFELNRIPISTENRESLRKAVDNGMSRW